MTTSERDVTNARIAELLHALFLRIRFCTYEACLKVDRVAPTAEINDLADLAHNLPRYIVGHDEHAIVSLAELREAVVGHVRRFYPSIDLAEHLYVTVLDMDAGLFLRRYRDHDYSAAEAAYAG